MTRMMLLGTAAGYYSASRSPKGRPPGRFFVARRTTVARRARLAAS